MRGWKDAAADPSAGIAALLRQFPTTREDFLVAGLPDGDRALLQRRDARAGLGWMVEQDWAQTVAVLREYGGMDGSTMQSLYTNDFVPMD